MSKTYEHTGQMTEWDDILIKKGITTRDAVLESRGLNPEDFRIKEDAPAPLEFTQEELLGALNADQLDELDEDEDYADTRILDSYRQQRINQLKEAAFRNRFGEVFDIVKNDWIREVTEASNSVTVIVHLYENSIVECEVLDEAMRQLAPKFKYLKFLRIKSTHAIENWPEKNLPALFIYEDGAMKTQLVTLKALDGKSSKAEDLEWFLAEKNIIKDSELDEDPKLRRTNVKKTMSAGTNYRVSTRDSDDDDDDTEY